MKDAEERLENLIDRGQTLLYELDRPRDALLVLYQALAIAPKNSTVLYLLGVAHFDYALIEMERHRWLQVIRELLRGVRFCYASIRVASDSGESHALRARLFNLLHLNRRAVEAARAALRCEPELSLSHFTLAECLLALGKYEEALDEARAACTIEPYDIDNHLLLAQIAKAQKMWHSAENYCLEAMNLEPNNAKIRHCLGEILWEQNRKPEAIERFYEALQLEPESYTYKQAHSKAVRSFLLPDWATGKGIVRLIGVSSALWTALIYAAMCFLGHNRWIAACSAYGWGVLVQLLLLVTPNVYLPSYRRRLNAPHSPTIDTAFQEENASTALPEDPALPYYVLTHFLLIALLSRYGGFLIAFWARVAEWAGIQTVRNFLWLSVLIFCILNYSPPQKEKPAVKADVTDEDESLPPDS